LPGEASSNPAGFAAISFPNGTNEAMRAQAIF